MSNSLLTVEMKHRIGAVALDVEFALAQPWTVLFGPSGSGKTTVLRTIAGFLKPDEGRIEYGDALFFDSSTKSFAPPHLRPVRSAGQSARLFPHMTVLRNVLYGSGWTSKPHDALDITQQVLSSFQVSNYADRMPRELSGGEAQRASVARALVSAITFDGLTKPLLLLDEPLSGLDGTTRDVMIAALKQWTERWKIPVLSVTHDIGEAHQLGAEIVKIGEGRVVEQGPVTQVLAQERTRLLNQLS